MSTLVVQTFLSLDGVMQAPGMPDEDRDGGFEQGGWMTPHFDDQMVRVMNELHARADGLLLGRRTYENMAAYWPHISDDDNPVASKMHSVAKYVASRTLDKLEWNNSTLLEGEVSNAVATLKRRQDGEIQVVGSGQLVQTLMANDLIDVYRLVTFPVLIGAGKRLFASGTVPTGLKLADTTTLSTGVAINTYERLGKPVYGSLWPVS